MAGAIHCVVEEKDIGKTPGAYAKIKDAVTSRRIAIRKMRTDTYMMDNTTHWIQCANHQEACPVFEGDTRITVIFVPKLEKEKKISKEVLIDKLKEEAPHFMRTLMDLLLPPPLGDRLRIPIISTQYKEDSVEKNRSMLDKFILEHLYEIPGVLMPFSDFYTRFIEWLPVEEKGAWSRIKVSRSMPTRFLTGSGNQNKTYVINASFEPMQPPDGGKKYYISGGKIKREE
jgi:hypothetical protein